jgi:hypothetical protein
MHKLAMTTVAATAMLLGTSFAASASSDDYYEHGYYRGYYGDGYKKCRSGDKRCKRRYSRYRRGHEWREHRYRDRGYRYRRYWYHDDD